VVSPDSFTSALSSFHDALLRLLLGEKRGEMREEQGLVREKRGEGRKEREDRRE